jgi:hypothetical protein
MENVKFKNSLKQHDFVFSLIKKGKMKVMEIENYQLLKLNQELTKYVSNAIEEEMIASLDQKVDKKEILTEIMKQVFTDLTEDELKILENQVTFLLDNKHIKKKNLLKLVYRFAKSVILASK